MDVSSRRVPHRFTPSVCYPVVLRRVASLAVARRSGDPSTPHGVVRSSDALLCRELASRGGTPRDVLLRFSAPPRDGLRLALWRSLRGLPRARRRDRRRRRSSCASPASPCHAAIRAATPRASVHARSSPFPAPASAALLRLRHRLRRHRAPSTRRRRSPRVARRAHAIAMSEDAPVRTRFAITLTPLPF